MPNRYNRYLKLHQIIISHKNHTHEERVKIIYFIADSICRIFLKTLSIFHKYYILDYIDIFY